jgi:hypothetical protein
MAQRPSSSHSPADRAPNEGDRGFALLMAIVPTTFIVILVGILMLDP